MSHLHVCVCIMCVPGAFRVQESVLDLPVLDLEVVVGGRVAAGT